MHFPPLCFSLLKNKQINQYHYDAKFLNLREVNSVCRCLAECYLCGTRVANCKEPYWPSSFNKLTFGKNTRVHYVSHFLEEILVQLRSGNRSHQQEQTTGIFHCLASSFSILPTSIYFLLGLIFFKRWVIHCTFLKNPTFLHEKRW